MKVSISENPGFSRQVFERTMEDTRQAFIEQEFHFVKPLLQSAILAYDSTAWQEMDTHFSMLTEILKASAIRQKPQLTTKITCEELIQTFMDLFTLLYTDGENPEERLVEFEHTLQVALTHSSTGSPKPDFV